MPEKILVTGAGGFIGHHLVRFLKKRGYWVRGVDIKYPEFSPKDEADEFLILDLRDFRNCLEAVKGVDKVYQLAANMGGIGFITEVKAEVMRDNVLINVNMAEASRINKIKRIFYSSSACIYPTYKQENPEVAALKESDAYPADPDSCFTPETTVFSNPKIVTVSDLREGNYVLSDDGTFRIIKKILRREYNGTVRVIKTWMTNIPLKATPNHPFLVAKRIKGRKRKFSKPIWLNCEFIEKGDALVIPTMSEIKDKSTDEGFFKLAGFYLAEGSIDHKKYFDKKYRKMYFNGWRITLWFNKKETILLEDIKNYLNKENINFTQYKHSDKLICLEIRSKKLSTALEEFGKGAENKRIPLWVMQLPPNKQKFLLDAYILGDGYTYIDQPCNLKTQVVATISKILAYQLFQLFLRQNLKPSLLEGNFKRWSSNKFYIVKVRQRKETPKSNWASWIDNGYYFTVVRENKEEKYEGYVYNSEIDETHSYTVSIGYIVHNSYGWEKLFSERLYKSYHEDYGLEVRIARFHNIYGPEGTYEGGREKAPAALSRKIAKAKDNDTIEVWADGQQTRSFCYIDDCLEGVFRLMESDYREPLNIGSDRLVTIDEMVDIIAKIANKNIGKNHLLDKPQGVRGRNSDNTLCQQVLGWTPKVSLEEGLVPTYKWIEGEVQKSKNEGAK